MLLAGVHFIWFYNVFVMELPRFMFYGLCYWHLGARLIFSQLMLFLPPLLELANQTGKWNSIKMDELY